MKRAFATTAVVLLTACASIQPVPYSPQPSRIKDPVAETRTIILSNTTDGCIAEPSFSDAMLVVKFACSHRGLGSSVLRFDRVEGIELQQYKEWYRVLVHQSGGASDFTWTSKSKGDMERLADALTALSKPTAAKHVPTGGTSL
jgi:hypothetical protein